MRSQFRVRPNPASKFALFSYCRLVNVDKNGITHPVSFSNNASFYLFFIACALHYLVDPFSRFYLPFLPYHRSVLQKSEILLIASYALCRKPKELAVKLSIVFII